MNALSQFLIGLFGPLGPMIGVGVVAVALIGATLPVLMKRREDPLERLRDRERLARGEMPETRRFGKGRGAPQRLRNAPGSDKLDRYANFLEPKSQEELSESRKWLQRAGYRSPTSVRTFTPSSSALPSGCWPRGHWWCCISTARETPRSAAR